MVANILLFYADIIDMLTKTIKCKVCKQEFETFKALREHERYMTEVKKFKDHQGFDAY
jgi:C2H2-type zinc finger protein